MYNGLLYLKIPPGYSIFWLNRSFLKDKIKNVH